MSSLILHYFGAQNIPLDEVSYAVGLHLNYFGVGGITYRGESSRFIDVSRIIVESADQVVVSPMIYKKWPELDSPTASKERVALLSRKIMKNIYNAYFDSVRKKLEVIPGEYQSLVSESMRVDIRSVLSDKKMYEKAVEKGLEVHSFFWRESDIKNVFEKVVEPSLDDLAIGQAKISSDTSALKKDTHDLKGDTRDLKGSALSIKNHLENLDRKFDDIKSMISNLENKPANNDKK